MIKECKRGHNLAIYIFKVHLKWLTGFAILIWTMVEYSSLFTNFEKKLFLRWKRKKVRFLSSYTINNNWICAFLRCTSHRSCHYASVRWWLLKLLLNFYANTKGFFRQPKHNFVCRPLPSGKNSDNIERNQEHCKKVWVLIIDL